MKTFCPSRGVVRLSGFRGEDLTSGRGNSGGLRPPSELCFGLWDILNLVLCFMVIYSVHT